MVSQVNHADAVEVEQDGTSGDVAPATAPWREVALSDAEYELIVDQLGRDPTSVELGMFGAMWSEHCGYKHSRPLLRLLPTTAPWVLQGPGENAGAVDIGDGLAVVFKVESHNHPSAVEPYQGAATGVGGIVRDIFTMGARPIAILDGLRFGRLENPRSCHLLSNVVAGIGGYGNCLGIPTVGGDLFFDESFAANPMVNALCAGIAKHDEIVRARAGGPGNAIMLIGAETGRDGLHGATFASIEDPEASHRSVVQVGNPFLEKLLMEACLELLQGDDIVAMQDLGAAGLTSSVVECASRGSVGAEIDVALVPRREDGMSPYEVMLSESQERMLLVVKPSGVERIRSIVERWSLHATQIGTITDDRQIRVRNGEAIVADVPARLYTDACPVYEPAAREATAAVRRRDLDLSTIPDLPTARGQANAVLLRLLGSANVGSRRGIYSQYDHTIQTNTVVGPGEGDAAVLRIKGTTRGIAISLDCNSRYCELDPYLGAQHAVAEATRNLSCAGARPLAITNCLNFGSPQKPEGYYQLHQSVRGMADACRALDVPVVSGNVSLYNETGGRPIMPTPMIGAVGVLESVVHHGTMLWHDSDRIVLVGRQPPTIGGSEYLSVMHEKSRGAPPALDCDLERRVQAVVRTGISSGWITTAHDCAEGGLVVALAEMAILSDLGMVLGEPPPGENRRSDESLFGEAASRIVVAIAPGMIERFTTECERQNVPRLELGWVEGDTIQIGSAISVTVEEARSAFESALSVVKSR